jgi:hypothetical protein
MKVTVEWLKKQLACPDAVAAFRKEFGRSVEVTPATLRRAQKVLGDFESDVAYWMVLNSPNLTKAYDAAIEQVYKIPHSDSGPCLACKTEANVARRVLLAAARV